MAAENLIPMTIRLEGGVAEALAAKANASGQEIADYAADVLTRDVLDDLPPSIAARVQAELELKKAAIDFAKDETDKEFDEGITLKVFQHIRTEPHLSELYKRAIGGKDGFDRGNPIKARINRTFGAAIKTTAGAIPKTINGNVLKAQVTGEFIQSYTLLEPDTGKKRGK